MVIPKIQWFVIFPIRWQFGKFPNRSNYGVYHQMDVKMDIKFDQNHCTPPSISSQADTIWYQKNRDLQPDSEPPAPRAVSSLHQRAPRRRDQLVICSSFAHHVIWSHLVGGIPTPLKNMKVSWDDDIPNIWEKNGVPNHQPAIISDIWCKDGLKSEHYGNTAFFLWVNFTIIRHTEMRLWTTKPRSSPSMDRFKVRIFL